MDVCLQCCVVVYIMASVMGWSLVHRNHNGCGLIVCDLVPSKLRQPRTKLDYCITDESLCNVKQYGCVWKFSVVFG